MNRISGKGKSNSVTISARYIFALSCGLGLAFAQDSAHAQTDLSEVNFRPNRLLRERGISPPEERFRWFYEERAYPYDTLKQGYLLDAYNYVQASSHIESHLLSWTSLGPRPQITSTFGTISGRIPAIAPHPTDPNIVYLGGANGGVWRTTNGGVNWIPISDNIPSLATGSLALDPSNPNILYYGTGEKYNANYVYGGVGVLKTANAMHASPTWEVSGLSNEKRIAKIVVDPNNSSIVFAAAWGGLYRSTNAGGSWTQVLGFGHVWDVRIHPTNSNIVYAAVGQNSTNAGMWRSTSGGITGSWVQQTNGLPAPSAIRRIAFDISASNSSILYAIMAASSPNGGYLGLYRTFDGGQNWELAPDSSLASLFGSPGSAGQGWYDICLAINPSDHNTIFVGGVRLYRTTNAGLTWTSYGGSGGLGVDFHEIVFGPGAVYIGLDQGIWKSTNNGESWINLNTDLTLAQFYAIGVGGPSAPRKLIAGGQDIGTLRTSGSVQWPTGFLGDGAMGLIDPVDTNLVYASGAAGLRYRSTNGGSSYSSINTGISLFESRTWVTPFFMDRQNPEILYTATDRLYRTTNRGDSWVPTTTAGINGTASVRWIEIDPTNSSIIYVASHTRVSRSMDGGATWVHVSSGLPSRIVTRVVVDPLNPATLYATVSGTETEHVFRSSNRGEQWASISANLPDIPVNALVVSSEDNNTVYIGTDLGIWVTTNRGISWMKDGTFPNTPVIDLRLDRSGFLIAATHGRGVFKAPVTAQPFITVISPRPDETLFIGSQRMIRWESFAVPGNVRIEISRDGGSTFQTLFASTPNDGEQLWTVLGPHSVSAVVRIKSLALPAVTQMSEGVFVISDPVDFLADFTIRDHGADHRRLFFGTAVPATDGIDPSFGEVGLSARPPQGTFDVRWAIEGSHGSTRDIRAPLGGGRSEIVRIVHFQPGAGGYPMRLTWDPAQLPAGSFLLVGESGSTTSFQIDMHAHNNLIIDDESIASVQLIQRFDTVLTFVSSPGWSVFSLPVSVTDRRISAILPSATSPAYRHTPAGYLAQDTLDYGTGYFVRFDDSQSIPIRGAVRNLDTVSVRAGWNLIGAITHKTPVESIGQRPAGIISSPFFARTAGGYAQVDTLRPMGAYWVRSSQNGSLILRRP